MVVTQQAGQGSQPALQASAGRKPAHLAAQHPVQAVCVVGLAEGNRQAVPAMQLVCRDATHSRRHLQTQGGCRHCKRRQQERSQSSSARSVLAAPSCCSSSSGSIWRAGRKRLVPNLQVCHRGGVLGAGCWAAAAAAAACPSNALHDWWHSSTQWDAAGCLPGADLLKPGLPGSTCLAVAGLAGQRRLLCPQLALHLRCPSPCCWHHLGCIHAPKPLALQQGLRWRGTAGRGG